MFYNTFFSGLGLYCYQCDSKNHPDCKENFDWDHLDTITVRSTECAVDGSEYCVKTTGVWGGKKFDFENCQEYSLDWIN